MSNENGRRGNLIIVSGPSGAGKSALAASVLAAVGGIVFSVSHTTRAKRGGERDGVDYHFVGRDEFDTLARSGEFLEWAEVYGHCYGTSGHTIEAALERGDDVLLDVDVQGAATIRGKRADAISVFIMPPSYRILRERLEQRKLDKDYVIEQRLKIAREEIVQYRNYDYLIINRDLSEAIAELKAIILGARCRTSVRVESARSIIESFGGMNAERA